MTALTVAEATALETAHVAPTALRRLPVPVAEPRAARSVVGDQRRPAPDRQDLLPLPVGPDGVGRPQSADDGSGPPRARRGRTHDEAAVEAFCAPSPTPTQNLPEPSGWTRQFVQAAVEVASGQRPAGQLGRYTSEDVLASLSRRGRLSAAQRRSASRTAGRPDHARRAVVLSVRTTFPVDGVVEACSVVNDNGRMRAVALRLEGLDSRWRVTALEIG